MPNECLVIALILGIMIIGFFRARRKNWGFAVLPLMVTPLTVGIVMYIVSNVLKLSYPFMLPLGLIVGSLAATCIWIGIASMVLIKTKKLRISYTVASVAFSLALAFILLVQYQIEFGY